MPPQSLLGTCLAGHVTHKAYSHHKWQLHVIFLHADGERPHLGLLNGPALFAAKGISSFSLYRWSPASPRAAEANARMQATPSSSNPGSRNTIAASQELHPMLHAFAANQSTSPAPAQPINSLAPHLTAGRCVT